MLDSENPDVVVGTESWLNSTIASGEVFPSNYNVFCKDGISQGGGGVFIAVKNNLIVSVDKDLQTDCELIWITICVTGLSPIYIRLTSIMPRNLIKSLTKIPPNASVWLLGDFNLPDVDWESVAFKPSGQYPAISKHMIDTFNDHNLHQLVREPT